MSKNQLILTGFMAVGKSSVGPRVAEALKIPFFDTDELMETTSGIHIPTLVEDDIAAFRILEAQTLGTILELEEGVVSTGGGIVSTEVGRYALLSSDVPVIFMNASFDISAARAAEDSAGRERPLFKDINKARTLYEERQTWYQETATHVVDAEQPVEIVAGEIINIARSR